jgi:hypothetical protein
MSNKAADRNRNKKYLPMRTLRRRIVVKKKYRIIIMWNAQLSVSKLSSIGSHTPP